MLYTFIILSALAYPPDYSLQLDSIASTLQQLQWQAQRREMLEQGYAPPRRLPNYACSKSGTGLLPPCIRYAHIAQWRRAMMMMAMAYKRRIGQRTFDTQAAALEQFDKDGEIAAPPPPL